VHLGMGEPWSKDEYTAFRAGYEAWCRENGKPIYPDQTLDKTSLTEYVNSWTPPESTADGRHVKR
jgi:hypothetical protein